MLGYDGRLYLLAFDHRGSFQKKMFGVSGEPNAEETERISDAKHLIWEGFQRALDGGAPRDAAGVLVDEQFGTSIAEEARAAGVTLAMPVEKSGQDEFDFEYGEDFGAHIERFDPAFTKVLVRYNPEGDPQMNNRQALRLRRLGDWLHERERRFLFELLVPATPAQLAAVDEDVDRFDVEVRPGLMLKTIHELREAGVEPDVWKIEGIDQREDCEAIAAAIRSDGRDGVIAVVLGRGADSDRVDGWLRAAATVEGYRGFAIGRSIWWDALEAHLKAGLGRPQATAQISASYRRFIEVYEQAAAG